MTDVSFPAIGAETMRQCWPVFAAGAIVQTWLVMRSRRSRHFPVRWIAPAAIVSALLAALLGVESFLTTQLAYETVGEGARAQPWLANLEAQVARSWPLAGVAVLWLALVREPRARRTVALLTAGIGILLSWTVAMWLFVTNHGPLVFGLLVLPGGLGVVASVVGFTAAGALWMATAKWLWRREYARPRRPPDVHVEVVDWHSEGTRAALPEGEADGSSEPSTRTPSK